MYTMYLIYLSETSVPDKTSIQLTNPEHILFSYSPQDHMSRPSTESP